MTENKRLVYFGNERFPTSRFPIAFCLDNGFAKSIYVNREVLHGVRFFLALFHEAIHYLSLSESLDEIYERCSLINLVFKREKIKNDSQRENER